MFTWFWLPGRRARQALAAGRPEQAREILDPYGKAGHQKALSLLGLIGAEFLKRAERAIAADSQDAAWDDLLAAEATASSNPAVVELRATLTKLAAATCKAAFVAGNLEFLRAALSRLKARAAVHPAFDWLPSAANDWQAARELAERGDFSSAIGLLDRTRNRVPLEVADGLIQARDRLADRYEQARPAEVELFAAVNRKEWREVHRWAETVLALAPEHRPAREYRAMAWERLAMSIHPDAAPPINDDGLGPAYQPTRTGSPLPSSSVETRDLTRPAGSRRLFLDLDGVGGFLLLFKDRILIGADANPGPIDVPVTASLQRMHAAIARDAEGGYLIEPQAGATAWVNGEPVADRRALKCGDEVRLGLSFRFRFAQPNALSSTAVLTPLSCHPMGGHATAIVLLANNLLVGPADDSHIPTPRSAAPLIFYATGDGNGLGVRAEGSIRMDTFEFQTNAVLRVPCTVETDEFRFRLDVYDPRS